MKRTLIILSDLWGKENFEWLDLYIKRLESLFHIQYYDSCELAGIDKGDGQEAEIHQQFVNGGIDRAAEQLLENVTKKISILAFSVGGSIAWKAGLMGLEIDHLIAISSTRLRKETKKPRGKIHLLFAENDVFAPKTDWFKQMNLTPKMFRNSDHEMYTNMNIADRICRNIIQKVNE